MESGSFQLELNYSLACDMGVLTFTSWGHCEDYLRECKHLLHRVCRILLWLRAQGLQSWCMKLTCGWPRCKAASAPVSTQETTGWLPVRLPFLRALFGCKATGVEVRNKLQAYFSDILHPNQEIKYGHNFLHNDFILNIYMFNAKHIYVYRKVFFQIIIFHKSSTRLFLNPCTWRRISISYLMWLAIAYTLWLEKKLFLWPRNVPKEYCGSILHTITKLFNVDLNWKFKGKVVLENAKRFFSKSIHRYHVSTHGK